MRHAPLLFARLAALLLLMVSLAAGARDFEGVVTHVTDGDSLWIRPSAGAKPRQVRVEGIDAPEICQIWGVQAREAFAARVLNRRVKVQSRRRDDYQRQLGRLTLEGGEDVGAWMVTRGHAWSYRYRKNPGPYAQQEAQAIAARRGLWAQPGAISPRDFRKQHGSCHPR